MFFHILFIIILFVEILICIYNLVKLLIFNEKAKSIVGSNNSSSSSTSNYKINILIPCLREQDIIKNTLNHFSKIINTNTTNIYIITTDKEIYEKNASRHLIPSLANDIKSNMPISLLISKYNKLFPSSILEELVKYNKKSLKDLQIIINDAFDNYPTTFEYISNLDFVKSNNVFHIINYPYKTGSMAEQLNYAIKIISNNCVTCPERTYFSIYNADSLPDENTFMELDRKIVSNNFPQILQQYSIFDSNFSELSFIMKGFSVYQTSYELKNGIINNIVSSSFYSPHVVGHGLTIRLDTLKQFNGFNTNFWCEDIYLTAQINNSNIHIVPLFALENTESPKYLNMQIKQNAVWFKTAFQHIHILKDIKRTEKISLYGYLWLASEFRATFSWLLMPIFILYSFIFPLINLNPLAFISSVLIYLLFAYVNYCLNIKIVQKFIHFKFSNNISVFFGTCIALLLTNLGPIFSFFTNEKHKTAH